MEPENRNETTDKLQDHGYFRRGFPCSPIFILNCSQLFPFCSYSFPQLLPPCKFIPNFFIFHWSALRNTSDLNFSLNQVKPNDKNGEGDKSINFEGGANLDFVYPGPFSFDIPYHLTRTSLTSIWIFIISICFLRLSLIIWSVKWWVFIGSSRFQVK